MSRKPLTETRGRLLLQRDSTANPINEDAGRYLELAAFADGRLGRDEEKRVAEWLAQHPDAAQDVAAARALGGTVGPEAAPEAVVARACAIFGNPRRQARTLLPLGRQSRTVPRLGAVFEWGGVAAAIVLAGWLGFTLGMDASQAWAKDRLPGRNDTLQDIFSPSPNLLPDLTGALG